MDKTTIPNVSLVRSVKYGSKAMKIYKASGIGSGISIKYKSTEFENNMKITSPFTQSINDQSSKPTRKRYEHYPMTFRRVFLVSQKK